MKSEPLHPSSFILQTFFQKFDLFADAPDAVAKMRSLILELAVRGQLTSANSHPSAPSDPSANPFPIPQGWQWVTLQDAAETRAAAKISPGAIADNAWVLDLEDIDGATGKVLAQATFAERRSQSTKAAFLPGDVLYGKLRPYLNKVVVAQAAGFCTTEIIPLRPRASIMAQFLKLFLRSPHFLRFAEGKSYGMKMPRLGTKDLESAPIPLPPLAEQKRIVAKVDELMALCDQLEAQQQERETKQTALSQATLSRFAETPTPTNLNLLFHSSFSIQPSDLRKTILTLAVQGSLSASSTDWKATTLQEVSLLITDGEHATPARTPAGIPLATAKNVRDGFLDLTITDFVAPLTAEKCWRRCKPSDGDVLMVCVGATTGRVCRVNNPPDMVLVRSVALLRPDQMHLSSDFLDVFLRSPMGQKQIWAGVKQNAQPCLYLSKMKAFQMLLPPLAEQKRIVAKVEELMALVDALEAQQAAADQAATHLLDAVVSELAAAA